MLRFLTCGSVDDGKSTLIGRLLYDSKLLFDDQLAKLKADSARFGTTGGAPDMALLVDGLRAEREQGITIDVAYRYFTTERRKFIVADTPGHEQYTRNMVTGASTADLAIVLVDARKGLLNQTRRHSYIVSLLGIRYVVLAINKMDTVGWNNRAAFEKITADYRAFAQKLELSNVTSIPLSALNGDNISQVTDKAPWYSGPSLLAFLEDVEVTSHPEVSAFRMAVQWVNRPDQNFRGYCGTVASGKIRRDEPVVVLPSGQSTRIKRIVTFDGDLPEATAGQAITLTFEDEVDASRGDIVAAPEAPPTVAGPIAGVVGVHCIGYSVTDLIADVLLGDGLRGHVARHPGRHAPAPDAIRGVMEARAIAMGEAVHI